MKKILLVTNMYPNERMPYYGIFVKEQFDELSKNEDIFLNLFFINAIEKGKLEYIKSIFKIFKKTRKEKFDVIHIHYGLSGLFLLFFKPKTKIFLTLHGGDILIRQGKYFQVWLTKKIIKKVYKIFILNQEMEDIVKKNNINYHLLPCGINKDFFKPESDQKTIISSKKIIVFPGDPNRIVKNFPLFLNVIQILKTEYPSWEIEFKCIHNVSREQVRDLLCSADCLLMTSISEGSPQVVKEALSCNLPVVSLPVGDVCEILKDIPSCHTSQTNDAHELSYLITLALKERSANIRNCFLKKRIYDNSWVANAIVKEYEQA